MDDQKLLKKRLKALMNRPENQICADCPERQPRWASIIVVPPGAPPGSQPLGAFMCLECSGSHRRLGVHITFVRSVNLDSWKEKEVLAMENGGNARVNAIFEGQLPNQNLKPHNHADGPTRERYIRDKYERRKFYDPSGFTSVPAAPVNVPRKANSPVPNHENEGNRIPTRRSESVGPPSDAARQRLEERKQRLKHSNSALDKPSNSAVIVSATSAKEKQKKNVTKTSAPTPSVDLLDFGEDTGGISQPNNQIDLFNINEFPNDQGGNAPLGADVATGSPQQKSGGMDMFEFLTRDMSTTQSQKSQPFQPHNSYGGDILSLYNNNNKPQVPSYGNGMINDPVMNASMPSLVSYSSSGFADSFSNLGISGSNLNTMGVMQQRNQMVFPQQQNMNNAMPMNASMMSNHMMNNSMMHNSMTMQANNGMMMHGGAHPFYAQAGFNMNRVAINGGSNPMYQHNSYSMPGYNAGQGNYTHSVGVGNQMGQANFSPGSGMTAPGSDPKAKKQPVVEKDDPFAQFGMNVFRS